jgi:hypothetical protein
MIARLLASLRGLLRRRRIEGEIVEELRDHLEREIEARQSQGFPPEEARRLALRDLGGLDQTLESTRAVRSTWLDSVWQHPRRDRRQPLDPDPPASHRTSPARRQRRRAGRRCRHRHSRRSRPTGQILRLFLRRGVIVLAVGIGCGAVAAVTASRSLASLVFGIDVTDPATLGTVAAFLTVITLLACCLPARSASRIAPSKALRSE